MVRPEILIDGEVVAFNRQNLTDTVAHVPTSDALGSIQGDQQEHASAGFYTRLKAGAEMLGTHADVVASAVKQNAQALKQTVEALQESDKTSATEASALTELVEGTAKTTTDQTVAESQKTVAEEHKPGSGSPAPTGDKGAADDSATAGDGSNW